ncbi:hypothetical protein GON01_03495 [Sphingomonas sp. MAH-20]|uniref:Tryptophan-rich sensory protein n=2 Tax=Sphingomonadaceae TaxID=41297 RepID=A0A6I4IXS9_9SPHN|nr:hypothetical protein [Sphingomonas sp. CGMCC 1.13658]MVO77002.1 hypothetical protein [Sphingomonas horti]
MNDTSISPSGANAVSRTAPILFAALQILTPLLPQFGLGEPIGEQSDRVRTLITPAGWAFSIWGALYAGSIVFAAYQALPSQRHNSLLAQIRWPAAGAFLGNALWALYTQIFGLSAISAIIILFTLVCLIVVYLRFSRRDVPFSAGDRWCAVLPLSALASWLTAASIVNIAAALRFHGVEAGEAAGVISAAVIVAGGAIAAVALLSGRGNPPYALVFLWALAAIYVAGGQISGAVALAAAIAALMVIGATFIGLRQGGAAHWFR